MTTNTCTCDSIIQGSGGQTASYRILGVLCPTCESLAAEAEAYVPVNASFLSKSHKARVVLRERVPGVWHPPMRFQVYALDGHETLPRTRNFEDLDAARAYANNLWATL